MKGCTIASKWVVVVVVMCVLLDMYGTQVGNAAPTLPAECLTTVFRAPFFCSIEVHHTGTLPSRYSPNLNRDQLMQQICPCPDYEVRGFCLRGIYAFAQDHNPQTICKGFRDTPKEDRT